MPVWELSPIDNKKIVISIDADTQEGAIEKAKEISPEYKQYEKWICKKGRPSDIEMREPKIKTTRKEIKREKEVKPKANKRDKGGKDEIIIIDL